MLGSSPPGPLKYFLSASRPHTLMKSRTISQALLQIIFHLLLVNVINIALLKFVVLSENFQTLELWDINRAGQRK